QGLDARDRIGHHLGLALIAFSADQSAVQLGLRNVNSQKKHRLGLLLTWPPSPLRPFALYMQGPNALGYRPMSSRLSEARIRGLICVTKSRLSVSEQTHRIR